MKPQQKPKLYQLNTFGEILEFSKEMQYDYRMPKTAFIGTLEQVTYFQKNPRSLNNINTIMDVLFNKQIKNENEKINLRATNILSPSQLAKHLLSKFL